MSVTSTTRKAGPFSGDGVNVAFPFAYKVFQASDVLVVLTDPSGNETTQVLTSQYTVALNANQDGNPGGTVTMITAPATGYLLTLGSQVLQTQPAVLTNAGGFYPTVINDMLDRATIVVQQLSEKLARALTLPFSASSGVSAQLPGPVASNLLGWDALAQRIINYAGVASSAVSAAMAPVIASATTALGRTALGATTVGNALFTAVDAPTARTAIGAADQNGTTTLLTGVAGTNTITASLTGVAAYATGQVFRFIAAAKNTGAVTLNINSLGAKAITKFGATALVDGDIPNGSTVTVVYDGTQFQLAGVATQGSGASGWTKLPNGLILQYGQTVTSGAADVTVNLPIAFPTGISSVTAASLFGGGSGNVLISFGNNTASTLIVGGWVASTGARTATSFYWTAIGY